MDHSRTDPPETSAPLPYGTGPELAAPRASGTSATVWGVLLIVFGLWGLLNIATTFIAVFSGASFEALMPPSEHLDVEYSFDAIFQAAMQRPTFWAFSVSEVVIGAMSVMAGWWLVGRPRRIGLKLAITRAVLSILFLPLVAYEQIVLMQDSFDYTMSTIDYGTAPDAEQLVGTMTTLMRGVSYGAIVLTIVAVLAINGLLIFFMTRPGIREYIKQREEGAGNLLTPHYDASLGLPPEPPPERDRTE
jgi:hypothetical protein